MDIEYRKLLPQESVLYRKIRLESLKMFPEAFETTYQEAMKTEKLRLETDIEAQTFGRFVFGAFSDQELIGICTFIKENNNTGSLYQMYVKTGYQGNSIGYGLITTLIRETERQYEGIEIFLEVKSRALKAYHLYKKIGFKEEKNINKKEDSSGSIMMKYSP
ncbi:GNAT family N-acetyltransferase [Chryseobacterium sp.]|uniref:GNAT family N-acetyltransferase n=1 Tax=Chryseobacterium sp. TaxID=1871047 RepID=UPI0025C1D287|nr:GNAT family N-acetyltransferase [Chryseobacterium sp.]MBV8327764.1 GNAT family N-acetyltransferase [Chryseobacterium sp.]